MRHVQTLTLAVLVYGGSLGVMAITPDRADAQFGYRYNITPYGAYSSSYGVNPAGYYNYNYNYANYPTNYPTTWTNWGGNTTPSGYPQWYVNYRRWNRPNNAYYNPYRGYPGRRW